MDFDEVFWIWVVMYYLHEANKCLQLMENEDNSDEESPNETDNVLIDTFHHLYSYSDQNKFKVDIRLSPKTFHKLFQLIKADLKRNCTSSQISPKCRLFITLIYLAYGDNSSYLSLCFQMESSTVHYIVKETCKILWKKLSAIYLAPPKVREWEKIAFDLDSFLGLPNCVGALDGKYVNVLNNSTEENSNDSVESPILIFGVCDVNYKFTAAEIGAYCPQNDGSIFSHFEFGNRLLNGELNLPTPKHLPGSKTLLPYYFVGNSAFPLRDNLMRPYPGKLLSNNKQIFNTQLSKARRLIENTFGILTSRWKVLQSPINMQKNDAEHIVKATVVLHNFAKTHEAKKYCPANFVDSEKDGVVFEGYWRQGCTPLRKLCRASSNNASRIAFDLRTTLKNYLINEFIA